MAHRQFTWNPTTDAIIEETDGTGNVLVDYVTQPAPYGPLLSEKRGAVSRQYHFDALGSTRALTDDSETVTDTFSFDAWGSTCLETGSSDTTAKWVGQYGYRTTTVAGAASHSIRHRLYSTVNARWSSTDPLMVGRAVYTYAGGSPILWIDPSGLQHCAGCPPIQIPYQYPPGTNTGVWCGPCKPSDNDVPRNCKEVKTWKLVDPSGKMWGSPLPLHPPAWGQWYLSAVGNASAVLEQCDVCCPGSESPRIDYGKFSVRGELKLVGGFTVGIGKSKDVGDVLKKRLGRRLFSIWAYAAIDGTFEQNISLNGTAVYNPCLNQPCSVSICGDTGITELKVGVVATAGIEVGEIFDWSVTAMLKGLLKLSPLEVCVKSPDCKSVQFGVTKTPTIQEIDLQLELSRERPFFRGQKKLTFDLF